MAGAVSREPSRVLTRPFSRSNFILSESDRGQVERLHRRSGGAKWAALKEASYLMGGMEHGGGSFFVCEGCG